jgi:signal transduction histidine kinase
VDPKGKILLVDNEPANLIALQSVLEDMGHEIIMAHSGREALRCLMNEEISVILMDVQMPTMDGFETATLIRRRERSRQTPIIFLTAVGRGENEMFRGYQVGAVDYLIKPFIPEILRFKVAVLMELQAKTRDLKEANDELLRLNASLEERVRSRTVELEAQGRLLARSNEELGQFANLASHDLQEPLRSMSTYLYLLERELGPALGQEARSHIASAMDASKRMRELIGGLLSFSRLESAGQEPREVDCAQTVREVLHVLEGTIAEKKARVSAGPMPTVPGDPAMLRQVFQNLVDNALKFSNGLAPEIEVGGEVKEGEALLWVKDHGIGIAPKDFGKLFKLFKRLHTMDEYPGSGLGLALCKKIVERHGGRLWLESEPGKGSTFFFTLPAEPGHGDRDSKPRELEAIRGGGG